MSGQVEDDEKRRRQLETDKLALEVGKLREDLSVWSRIAAIVIPIALFVIGAAQTYIAWSDWRTKGAREQLDLDLKQIESGMKLVEFATAEAAHLTSRDPDEAKQAVVYVGTLLPADMACQLLNTLLIGGRVADDRSELAASMRMQIAQTTATPPASCTTKPRDKQDDAIIAITKTQVSNTATKAPATPTNAAAATSANAATCAAPPAHGDDSLVVYYQVVRKEDQALASTIGLQMPVQFPSAGVEYVTEPDPSKQRAEVRYYYADQKADADYLACLLTSAYASVVHGPPAKFEARSLVNRYKNLPTKRVEVWFPVMQAGS